MVGASAPSFEVYMILLECNQVEVVQVENKNTHLVSLDFYKRNWKKFIPADEYYVIDSNGFPSIDTKRIAKHYRDIEVAERREKDIANQNQDTIETQSKFSKKGKK